MRPCGRTRATAPAPSGSRRRAARAMPPRCVRGPPAERRGADARAAAAPLVSDRTASANALASAGASSPVSSSAISDDRTALRDRDDRQAARLRLEDHLPERVGAAREQEHVRAGVGAGEVALRSASRGRWRCRRAAARSASSSGPPPASTRCRRGSRRARRQECVRQQLDALLLGQPSRRTGR